MCYITNMVNNPEVEAIAHGGLLDVRDVSMADLINSVSPVLLACIARLRASLAADPSGVLSAFQSVVD